MELGVTGFLCSVCLQTKRRCFFCCRLIIIRGAQLSSAPLLTLFSQHYWSVLSRPCRHHTAMCISKSTILSSGKQSLDLIPEMKVRENRVTSWRAAGKMDFSLADCCCRGFKKGLRSVLQCCFCLVSVSCVKKQSFVLSGRRQYSADIAQPSTSCSLN